MVNRVFGFSFSLLSRQNQFVKNSITLSIGTSIAQAIPVLFSPILARLFNPEEFGLLATVSSITAIISVISTGKYETVILISRNKRDAAGLVMLSLLLSLLISFLALIIFFFFNGVIIEILKQPRLEHWIFICPLVSFFISIYSCYNEWCVKYSMFKQLSFNKIINTTSLTLSNLILGLSKVINGGLVIGELLGRFTTALFSVLSVARTDIKSFKRISLSRIKHLAVRYRECPIYILPAQLINTLAAQLIILLISSFFGDTEVGLYSMTAMVLSVPSTIISQAIRDVFRQRANEEYKEKGNALYIYKKTTKFLFLASFLVFGILFIILPDFFAIVFGEKWRVAGEYARILCPTVMISFVAESVSGMFIIAEKMFANLVWQIVYFVVTVISLLIGYLLFKDMKFVMIFYSVGRSLVYILNISMSYRFAKGL